MPLELSLQQAGAKYHIPVRRLTVLVRTGVIDARLENSRILIDDAHMRRYRDEPHDAVRKQRSSYLSTLGPGLVTGTSDDDPSGIGTYSQVGSSYGLGLAWLAVYLLPMMIAVQETVARIGTVTQSGLAHVIGLRFGRRVLYPLVALLVLANTVNRHRAHGCRRRRALRPRGTREVGPGTPRPAGGQRKRLPRCRESRSSHAYGVRGGI